MGNDQTCCAGWTCSNCGAFVKMNGSHTCPTIGSVSAAPWLQEKLNNLKDDPGFAFEAALLAFEEELAKNQITMPPEFAELIEKHFWELI